MTISTQHLISVLVVTAVVAATATLGSRKQPDARGWTPLNPSAMHWRALWLSVGLVLLIAWVVLFVGSSRSDGPQQLVYASWLIAAFSLGTVASAAMIVINHRRAIRWRGQEIEFRTATGLERRRFDQISSTGYDWMGQLVLRFEDGRKLPIDLFTDGAAELYAAILLHWDGGASR